ncbi:MAG: transcriptional regulator [Bacteroidetes bacterium]|nr:transcriptional regulator [Bacteroidota bacterium]
MEKIFIDTPIPVITVTAVSFPDGVGGAYMQLHQLVQGEQKRRFFGISYGSPTGAITYKAAAEEKENGEAEALQADHFIIPAGWYAKEVLLNWKQDETMVGKTFQHLLQHPELDPRGFCLEEYPNEKDMVCLVKLNSGD